MQRPSASVQRLVEVVRHAIEGVHGFIAQVQSSIAVVQRLIASVQCLVAPVRDRADPVQRLGSSQGSEEAGVAGVTPLVRRGVDLLRGGRRQEELQRVFLPDHPVDRFLEGTAFALFPDEALVSAAAERGADDAGIDVAAEERAETPADLGRHLACRDGDLR